MTESKAIRAAVTIGAMTVDGFMLPDGSYRMSQTQAAASVGLSRQNASDFLRSNTVKALLGESYTGPILEREEIEIEPEAGQRGQSRFITMPLEVVSVYWLWQSHRGNKKALALCVALMTETLERRFDSAFGVARTEQERDGRLDRHIRQLEADLKEAADFDALTKYENDYLLSVLRQHDIDPWKLPSSEDQIE